MIPFDPYMIWLILGVILMILELVVPGVFLLWIGFAALATGILCLMVPTAPFAVLGAVFAVLSVAFAFLGHKLIVPAQKKQNDNALNNRMRIYIDKTFPVTVAVVDGRGKIAVEDTVWNVVADEPIAVGTTVKVVGFEGTALKVEPVSHA